MRMHAINSAVFTSRENWVTGVGETHMFSSVQLLSHVQLFATPWIAACQASLSITSSRSSLRLMSIESVMPSSHLILCRPLLLLPPIPPSISLCPMSQLFASGGQSIGSFSFNISPSNQHPGLIFRMDWLDLLAVQGTLESFQHHSSKASILLPLAFFIVQLSLPTHMLLCTHLCFLNFVMYDV